MTLRVGVAPNPASGKGRGEKYLPRLKAVLAEYPVEPVTLLGEDSESSRRLMREAVESGAIEALIVVGGDGMIHHGVNALGDSKIPLGVVAVGSGNDIAREFHFPIHKLEDSLHQVMGALLAGRIRDVDVLEFRSAEGVSRALAVAAVGIDADVNARTNAMTWPKGNLRYIRGIAQSLREFRPYGLRVTIDGKTAEGAATILSVANTRWVGGGICIAPNAKPDDGLADVLLARELRGVEFLSILPKLAFRRHTNDPRVHIVRGKVVEVEAATELGAHPPRVMADGEDVCPLPARIEIIPGALRLVV